MAKKIVKKEEEQLENVGEALSTTGQWIEEHQTLLSSIVLALVIIVVGFIAVKNYVIAPKKLEASNENAKAVVYFMQGNWDAALNGDDAECIGFEAIADKYGLYQQGELAHLYAGICYYQKGEYEEAAKHLKKFSADDVMIDPATKQLLGDAYVQMEEYGKAVSAYAGAAQSGNEIIAPMSLKKAGLVYLEMGNKKAARKAFEQIKDNYPQAQEAQDIEKFIALAE